MVCNGNVIHQVGKASVTQADSLATSCCCIYWLFGQRLVVVATWNCLLTTARVLAKLGKVRLRLETANSWLQSKSTPFFFCFFFCMCRGEVQLLLWSKTFSVSNLSVTASHQSNQKEFFVQHCIPFSACRRPHATTRFYQWFLDGCRQVSEPVWLRPKMNV